MKYAADRAVFNKLCGYLAQGMSLNKACEQDGMPTVFTVCNWLRQDAELRELYWVAKVESADHFAEKIVEILEDPSLRDRDSAAAARVRVDALKWVAAKLKPKRYGDRIEHSGEVTHHYVAQPIPVEQRNSDATRSANGVASPNGSSANGHSAR